MIFPTQRKGKQSELRLDLPFGPINILTRDVMQTLLFKKAVRHKTTTSRFYQLLSGGTMNVLVALLN